LAHFSAPSEGHTLPTLKVLGWDSKDTVLHLDAVARELTEQLSWPSDESDVAAWRAQWSAAFTVGHQEVITTSKALSIRLAQLARDIRDRISTALAIETNDGPLTKLMKAFQESLIHDLTPEDFADMYAQTIAYGLLSSRIADPKKKSVDDLAIHMRLSPFLKELMETFLKVGGRNKRTGLDFDELEIGKVVELLDQANMEAVVADFGDRNPQEDPVIHFYELFLKEYNAKKRMSRGVFYTPRPIVSYIVRSVDDLLRTEFELADGLADTCTWGEMAKRNKLVTIPDGVSPDQDFVQILDPASGTGTFLVETIDIIHKNMVAKWQKEKNNQEEIDALWNEYVPRHLLTRLHGYELLMAPYAIAHLKIGLKLHETGYKFDSDERARIYLTNALEPATDSQLTLDFLPALAYETQAVNDIKRNERFTVLTGNPPYANFGQLNQIPFILELLEDYKRGLGERKINLNDDFIKFMRFAQWNIERAGLGVVGMITSNTFLEGLTHRQMRRSLADTFNSISMLDLHGNSRKQESTPSGEVDENVFDIQQGVAVSMLVRQPEQPESSQISYQELWGLREQKYAALLRTGDELLKTSAVELLKPNWFFVPKNYSHSAEYEQYLSIDNVFVRSSSGVQTKRDAFTIQYSEKALAQVGHDLAVLPTESVREKYDLAEDGRDWTIQRAKDDLANNNPKVIDIMYRPFDVRKTFWTGRSKGFLGYPRAETMIHMLYPNLGMNVKRQMQDLNWSYASVTRNVVESAVHFSTPGNPLLFPLYHYENLDNDSIFSANEATRRIRHHNVGSALVSVLEAITQLECLEEGGGDLERTFGPEDVFNYTYAIFHSPTYRTRYADLLKFDFPRLPIPVNGILFRDLAGLGKMMISLQLLEAGNLDQLYPRYIGRHDPEIEKVSWTRDTVWVDKAQTSGFSGVSESVWNFHIGGYQVCEKWLKDRKGRTLSNEDVVHYQKIVVALSETIRLMKEIDEVIELHGGWPGAFAAKKAAN
jgi:predicted helicase